MRLFGCTFTPTLLHVIGQVNPAWRLLKDWIPFVREGFNENPMSVHGIPSLKGEKNDEIIQKE